MEHHSFNFRRRRGHPIVAASPRGTAHDVVPTLPPLPPPRPHVCVSVNEDATSKNVASLTVNNFSNYTGNFARVYFA
jgi:hypothetical protein